MQYPLNVNINSPASTPAESHSLVELVQHVLDENPAYTPLRLQTLSTSTSQIPVSLNNDVALAVDLVERQGLEFTEITMQPHVPALQVYHGPQSDLASLARSIAEEVYSIFTAEQERLAHLLRGTAYEQQSRYQPQQHLVDELDRRTTRSLKYAPTYHLTFSLFTSSSLPSEWDVETALKQYISPLLETFKGISNFTVDTQVQLHAAFSPSIAGPQYNEASGKWELQKTDLSGFINAAEWPLSPSIGAGPTINFVLYAPSKDQSPLVIKETGGSSWLIPQWGGVQILNSPEIRGQRQSVVTAEDLELVMITFADQLIALLGLPQSPPSLPMRLSSLTRERTISLILSASSTLGALSRLSLKLTSIAIPDSVARSVDQSIQRLEQACIDLNSGDFHSALENARIAEAEAEEAFFEPSMVGQVYFPDEHKVAVYVPLLGPMAVPLLMAALKELRNMRRTKLKSA